MSGRSCEWPPTTAQTWLDSKQPSTLPPLVVWLFYNTVSAGDLIIIIIVVVELRPERQSIRALLNIPTNWNEIPIKHEECLQILWTRNSRSLCISLDGWCVYQSVPHPCCRVLLRVGWHSLSLDDVHQRRPSFNIWTGRDGERTRWCGWKHSLTNLLQWM